MARWTGPLPHEVNALAEIIVDVPLPPERWPYGPPEQHEDCCNLFPGLVLNQRYCDCKASAADADGWGADL